MVAQVPEIIGLGALNVDYIASASRLSQRLADRVTESTARFEWNREGPVDRRTISRAIENLGVASLSCSLGGSAWLTIFALAQMQVGLSLGYVGVVGRMEAPGLSFIGQMEELGIDRRWVGRYPDRSCGLCLSYIDDADRVMLTYPGANFAMSHHIRENFDELAAYLAGARYVHVTSFLDDETPAEVLRVLTRAKMLNPGMRISFDPGFDWAEHAGPAVQGILALTDLLFVNYRELKALGSHTPGDADGAVAWRVLGRCAPGAAVFVSKRYDFIEAFQATGDGLLAHRFQRGAPLRETELEDATGAGDVFAAAVLSSLTARRLQVELGAFVGLCLARHKMRFRRPGDYQALPDLSKGFLQQTESPAMADRIPAGVALVHDGDPQRHVVRRFIERDCGLTAYELGTAEMGRTGPADLMLRHLDRCSFAVCLLSGRVLMPGGRARADQAIIHQAGLFQGRYGFGRVAIVAEEGCDTFSNIDGLIRLDFAPNEIQGTFFELERMFRREGLIGRIGRIGLSGQGG